MQEWIIDCFPSSSSPSLGYFIKVLNAWKRNGRDEERRHLNRRRTQMRESKATITKEEVVIVRDLPET